MKEAEAISELILRKWKKHTFGHYSKLLNVYINNNLTCKGKDLVDCIGDIGRWAGPLTWDALVKLALVKLYLKTGDVEKADSILQKAAQLKRKRPFYTTYIIVMEEYAKRGDIHNTENVLSYEGEWIYWTLQAI